jgi:hypothetical protein
MLEFQGERTSLGKVVLLCRRGEDSALSGGVGDRNVKIVMTLNIRHGGGDRVALIVKTIATWSPDTVVITEYRNGQVGELLRSSLAVAGWGHQVAAPTPERDNSVLIVGRQPVIIYDGPLPHADWQRDRHLVAHTSCAPSNASHVFWAAAGDGTVCLLARGCSPGLG